MYNKIPNGFSFLRRVLLSVLLVAMPFAGVFAQVVDGRSKGITLFPEYCKADITLASGNHNHQREANVFLKNGVLLFKQDGKIMEANMSTVKDVRFGDRYFVNLDNQLAELVDSCGGNLLLLLQRINIDELKADILNESVITNINMGDQLGVTRMEAEAETLGYPVDDIYYFVIEGKSAQANERGVRQLAKRRQKEAVAMVVNSYGFRWSDEGFLRQILKALSE